MQLGQRFHIGEDAGEGPDEPLRFPGQENAGEELSYNIFRWYRAGWGRYSQVDMIHGLPPFQYAGGSPVNYSDPLGLYVHKKNVSWLNDAVGGAWTDLPVQIHPEFKCDGCQSTVYLTVQATVHMPYKKSFLTPCWMQG
ncbi:MAG: RHS repeat domain-containing protein [Thermoanaerobaculia bacterium]